MNAGYDQQLDRACKAEFSLDTAVIKTRQYSDRSLWFRIYLFPLCACSPFDDDCRGDVNQAEGAASNYHCISMKSKSADS